MDKVTESLLKEFSKEHQLTSLDTSKKFEHFASYVVVRGEHLESFLSEDIVVGDGSSAGGGGDTGIDGIAIIANGVLISDVDELEELVNRAGYLDVTFLFVQAETSSSFDGAKIGTFGFGVVDFFKDTPSLKQNPRVAAAAEIMQAIFDRSSKFRRGNPVCKLYYVTTGKWQEDENLKARIAAAKADLVETGRFRSVDFIPVGASALQKKYQQSRHSRSARFAFVNKVTVPNVPGVEQAYVGILPWPEFKKLIVDDQDLLVKNLFVDNVRDWQGYNRVNSDIKNTLESDRRSCFVLMNNGVTVIAGVVQVTGNDFTVEDYQVVNGCQTSHVLYEQRELLDDSVSVPVRLIGTRDDAVMKSIIKATNWQTAISEEQLFALDEFPKHLELYFSALPAETRLYFERRSRQYDAVPVEKYRVVTFDLMLKAFAGMFLNEPHRTTRDFKGVREKLGKDIFVKGHRPEPYYAAALSWFRVESAFRAGTIESKYKVSRFQILLALRILCAGYEMPAFSAGKMSQYCKAITDVMSDPVRARDYIKRAVGIVKKVLAESANAGKSDRDTTRTEAFTKRVIEVARVSAQRKSQVKKSAK